MPRVRSGTQAIKGGPVILKEGVPGGLRKMRCPKCHGIITGANTHTGKKVQRCCRCGTQFTSKSM